MSEPSSAAASGTAPPGAPATPARILVVDDHPTVRLKLSLAVRSLGHVAEEAGDGEEALARLARGGIDLVLLDLVMPRLDGHGVLARMGDDMYPSDVPVIMVTGEGSARDAVLAIERGATDVLPKAFDPVLFRARVEACLVRKRLDDERRDHLAEISRQRDLLDALLAETLPERAIAELKATGTVRPQRYGDVIVLFADVVGFTAFCDDHPPEEAVHRLAALVDGFESIAAAHGLEKIKTSGDAFIATAGLLRPVERPVNAALAAASEMARAAPRLTDGWQVRVGLAQGPVVGGLVGRERLFFDVWGDAVNVAARLVTHAEPGTVCGAARLLAGDGRTTEPLGRVEVRGKGTLDAALLRPF